MELLKELLKKKKGEVTVGELSDYLLEFGILMEAFMAGENYVESPIFDALLTGYACALTDMDSDKFPDDFVGKALKRAYEITKEKFSE